MRRQTQNYFGSERVCSRKLPTLSNNCSQTNARAWSQIIIHCGRAGREVWVSLKQGGVETVELFIFEHPPHANIENAEEVRAYLEKNAVAVVVGAGSINDICKVAAYD
jgi:glycerol dehydrogenase-like iron-containing ADH family enzyme